MRINVKHLPVVFLTSVCVVFSSCHDKEIIPVPFTVTGPLEVHQTVTADYEIVPEFDQAGTIWQWEVVGAVIQSISADRKKATLHFTELPASGKVKITIYETSADGTEAEPTVLEVTVLKFCALNIKEFTGIFDCDEAGYGVYPVNFTKHPTIANTIVNDNFWDWPGAGATVYYTLSGDFDQKISVPKQNFEFGDGYVGWIEGSGTYDGCTHEMTIDYTVFYEDEEYDTHHEFTAAKKGLTYPVLQKKSSGHIR